MSTRCRIGIKLNDGRVVSIYNHSDGYPSVVGRILNEYYNTRKRVMSLMNLGDISILGIEPVDCPELWDFESGMSALAMDDHYMNIPFCRTYKGRNDENVGARISQNAKEFVTRLGEVYNYLYDGGWYEVYLVGDKLEYIPLGQVIKQEEENE